MKLIFPSTLGLFQDSLGALWAPDASGMVTIDPSAQILTDFLGAGFVLPVGFGAARPTVTYPGMQFFDTSLNSGAGLPIWRNTANTGWINAAGVTV